MNKDFGAINPFPGEGIVWEGVTTIVGPEDLGGRKVWDTAASHDLRQGARVAENIREPHQLAVYAEFVLEESLAMAKVFKADCIVYNGTPGCRNTWGMVKPFAREVEKYGYPVLTSRVQRCG